MYRVGEVSVHRACCERTTQPRLDVNITSCIYIVLNITNENGMKEEKQDAIKSLS